MKLLSIAISAFVLTAPAVYAGGCLSDGKDVSMSCPVGQTFDPETHKCLGTSA